MQIEGHSIVDWLTGELKNFNQDKPREDFWIGYKFAVLRAYEALDKELFPAEVQQKAKNLEEYLKQYEFSGGHKLLENRS